MNYKIDKELFQLIEGELDSVEAEALRARVESSPELQADMRAWEQSYVDAQPFEVDVKPLLKKPWYLKTFSLTVMASVAIVVTTFFLWDFSNEAPVVQDYPQTNVAPVEMTSIVSTVPVKSVEPEIVLEEKVVTPIKKMKAYRPPQQSMASIVQPEVVDETEELPRVLLMPEVDFQEVSSIGAGQHELPHYDQVPEFIEATPELPAFPKHKKEDRMKAREEAKSLREKQRYVQKQALKQMLKNPPSRKEIFESIEDGLKHPKVVPMD